MGGLAELAIEAINVPPCYVLGGTGIASGDHGENLLMLAECLRHTAGTAAGRVHREPDLTLQLIEGAC